jgi:hypothetical protein
MMGFSHQPNAAPRAVLSAGHRRRRVRHPGRLGVELTILTALILLALFAAEAKAVWT